MSRQDEKRNSILWGATEVFREDGFDSASMDRIAEVAGVSKRTVYNHFGSKDALFKAVTQKLIEQLHELKKIEWNPDKSLESQLLAFARAKTVAVDDPVWLSLTRVALGVAIKQPAFAREMMQSAKQGEDHLVTWLRKAHSAGRLKVTNPALAAELFWAMVTGALVWPQVLDTPLEESPNRVAGELIAIFLSRYQTSENH